MGALLHNNSIRNSANPFRDVCVDHKLTPHPPTLRHYFSSVPYFRRWIYNSVVEDAPKTLHHNFQHIKFNRRKWNDLASLTIINLVDRELRALLHKMLLNHKTQCVECCAVRKTKHETYSIFIYNDVKTHNGETQCHFVLIINYLFKTNENGSISKASTENAHNVADRLTVCIEQNCIEVCQWDVSTYSMQE